MKICPEDVYFWNYIKVLELAGITEEQLRAARVLDKMEKKIAEKMKQLGESDISDSKNPFQK